MHDGFTAKERSDKINLWTIIMYHSLCMAGVYSLVQFKVGWDEMVCTETEVIRGEKDTAVLTLGP